ncbi:MAG: ABC transporter permease [Oscillospiraceae bacterium]|nr:ABC transporter permease [Oscillospiraceae bacterium]
MAGESSVDYKGDSYALTASGEGTLLTGPDGTELFNIELENRSETIEVESTDKDGNPVTEEMDFLSTVEDADAFLQAMDGAISEGVDSFTVGENTYTLEKMDTEYHVTAPDGQLGVVVANSFTPVGTKYDALDTDLEFRFAMETAIGKGAPSFSYNGENFGLVNNGADYSVTNPKGEEIMLVSDIAYGPDYVGIELTVDFVKKLQEAMRTNQDSFVFVNQYGEETTALINIVNGNYYVSTLQKTTLIDGRAAPSSEHPLGTDVNGMDVFTRLMYGGRVSLIVGFVVVFFELFLGVIVGGISGYFGGVVDTILMRLVELFNAIPFYPMLIIIGSVMDNMHVGQYERLMMTMVLLGVLGWTGIARLVRGQILSLREQDFMVAAEATGIRTSRRIFRHLIPNVMPLLIVNATASLGGIILTEATLGYLGLGVKYPMASWGSIVNQVNDMQVMQTAWWIWIPAGLCILITVLGFNFAGDGLRDAFDPKMKR